MAAGMITLSEGEYRTLKVGQIALVRAFETHLKAIGTNETPSEILQQVDALRALADGLEAVAIQKQDETDGARIIGRRPQ